jgi:hypothetical protein
VKKLKITFFGLSLFMLSGTASAAGWYDNFKIGELRYSRGADGLHFTYSGGSGNTNSDNCDDSTMFVVPYTSQNPDRENAMIVGLKLAFTTNKTVRVFLSGCMPGIGGKSYPRVHYLYVSN